MKIKNIKHARIRYISHRFSVFFFLSWLHDCNLDERKIFNIHCFLTFNEML